jgi:hypothetical protein
MRPALLTSLVLLAGCAASPDYVASRGDFDVCRLAMGGPHARFADAEARNRGLDCRQYHGAILQQQSNQNAAIQQLQRQPALTCQTIPWGMGTRTICN